MHVNRGGQQTDRPAVRLGNIVRRTVYAYGKKIWRAWRQIIILIFDAMMKGICFYYPT